MKFSEAFKQSGQACEFSLDGNFVANAVQSQVVIRNVSNLSVEHIFANADLVQSIQWSPDSNLIMCVLCKGAIVQLWSVVDPDWTCKIDEGSCGLVSAHWSPDARHILTISEFHVRITVWSLVSRSLAHIRHVKAIDPCLNFSPDGSYLAVLERRECRDCVSLFVCSSWNLIRHFDIETKDAQGLSWSPDSSSICVWESCLEYRALIYSLDGRNLTNYSAYQWALGIRCVEWSPTAQFIGVGSYDNKMRLLNTITWKPIIDFDHTRHITRDQCIVYVMEDTQYKVKELPFALQAIKIGPRSAGGDSNSSLGVSRISFSHNGQYVATVSASFAGAVWIWDIGKLRLVAALVHQTPVTDLAWDEVSNRLAICFNTNFVCIWRFQAALAVQLPQQMAFNVTKLMWHSGGKSLLIIGSNRWGLCFLSQHSDIDLK